MIEENKEQINKEFEEIKKLLNSNKIKKYNKFWIIARLHEKSKLRKVFLSVIKNQPARISEIFESALLTKPTCYNHLHQLISFKLVERIFIDEIKEGKKNNDEVMAKFNEFIKTMPDNLKRYYKAKTSFWVVTDYGKQFAKKAFEFEEEFKENV